MWSFLRSIWLNTLATSTVAAQLSFVASVQQEGRDVDASGLNFLPIPPLEHLKHASDHEKLRRDPISYSSNWCGASQRATRQDGISSVVGYFTVPDLTLRPGQPAPQAAAAWVGIDGAECNSTLLQAGVTTIVNSNGGQSASAWWEWYPETAFNIEGLRVRPGDWMSVNITTRDASSGTVVITNVQRGYSVTLQINNGPKLCRLDAEWILEAFYDSGQQVPFARFSDLWFVESGATTVAGKNIGIDGATMVHIQADDGKILCSAEPYDSANLVMVSQG
ncbi:concanavalin A-like lectin/glucanase [Parathielavia appendiculata]|uniref:Concanavalin A-like lectin/glucanase n=1 Tax=Parathielavia appendiculata TaxID=2587402 RepID=A0AAN6Z7Z8_9PEZI|nr:concanavalin A-like lectin/glucanase [Parathielavia appendiculata]